MCTAITYQPRELYMGRSLDYEASYGEEIVMLPRRFPLRFRHGGGSEQGYAILGTAHVADGYPLYYDAVNEKGLGIAGLNGVPVRLTACSSCRASASVAHCRSSHGMNSNCATFCRPSCGAA